MQKYRGIRSRGHKRQRSRRAAVLVILAACLTLNLGFFPLSLSRADSPAVSTATSEGRLAVFDDVWQTINDRYYDANFHGVDWGAQRMRFRSQAAEARDQQQLYGILRRLLTSLRDAHTRVYSPEEKFDWQHPRFITVGLSLKEIEGQLACVSVERGSEAERAGIRAGDIIESIDGQPSMIRLQEKLLEQPDSSTPQAARLFAIGSLLNGVPGTVAHVEWRSSDNKLHKTSLTRRWYQRNPGLQIRYQGGVAIVTIDAFTHAIAADFARAANSPGNKLREARGLIIDLRGNGGGDAEAMAEIAGIFLPNATGLGQFTDRLGNVSLKLETGGAVIYSARNLKPLRARIVVLASERTSSAAEIFISALKQTNQVTVIGGQTCGCVLAVRMHHTLPDGGDLAVSELDYQTARGVRLEGNGIIPDIGVNQTRQGLYTGRDPFMDKAFTNLRRSSHH